MGVINPRARREWTQSLVELGDNLDNDFVFTAGAVAQQQLLGDRFNVGGTGIVHLQKREDPSSFQWTVGSEMTQFDVDACALSKAAELLTITYSEAHPPPAYIYIFSHNSSAIRAVLDPRSKSAHHAALALHKSLTKFCFSFQGARLIFAWSPKNDELHGDVLARSSALAATANFPTNGLNCIQSAAYQKSLARELAFRDWDHDYHTTRIVETFNDRNGLPTRHAFDHAIVDPPSTHNHPLWREAVTTTTHLGRKKPKYTRRTTSCAFQLAVDHAFTGSYAKRFRKADPPETHRCLCGHPMRDPNHLIRVCPLYLQQRVDSVIATTHDVYPLHTVFNHHPARLLSFISTTHPALSRPPDFKVRTWNELTAVEGIG